MWGRNKPCDSPRPGPDYWDWRCLRCDWSIGDHKQYRRRRLKRWWRSLTA